MKKIYIIIGAFSLLFLTACDTNLDQFPSNIASSDSLEDFAGVLNAAYFYNRGSVSPMAVMGDFRADNALMLEEPYTEFDEYDPMLTDMEEQFFGPFYTALYKSILSSNNVIENSTKASEVGEAKFLRALAYFKLVRVFGDVTINLTSTPSITDVDALKRRPASEAYNTVIIPDLMDAIAALGSDVSSGRATKLAAQGMLGKVYLQLGDFSSAQTHLKAVIDGAAGAGVSLQANFADIFGAPNDMNSEIIFATQISSSISDEYGFSEFWSWSGGLDTKSLMPLDPDLIVAFDAVAGDVLDATVGDLRRAKTIDVDLMASPKFPQADGDDHDWIDLRLADVILMYAEALNETGSSASDVLSLLDPLRTRAGLTALDPGAISSQAAVRQAIADERRMELAFEGHRWFDLVRTGTVDEEMGQTIDSRYYIFPIPDSEILATGVITQNDGY